MELYFSPLACSLASRAALYEAGAEARYNQVDALTKTTADGSDYRAVHPLALVPVLRSDEGDLLYESAAILQFIAARFEAAGLAPRDERGRAELQQWLSFIGTELHKATFVPLLDRHAPEGAKAYALEKAPARLAWVEAHLRDRDYLLDRFSVADVYLATILNWTAATPVKLDSYPNLRAYHARVSGRPAMARAFAEELALYQAEQRRAR